MFDFFLFGLYAAPIGKAFFATGDVFTDTSLALIVFWLGALMRPLGATSKPMSTASAVARGSS